MDFQSRLSPSSSIWKYDVTLTCCGDLPYDFYPWLWKNLLKEGLRTRNCWYDRKVFFIDQWYEPLKEMKESQIYMVVFSKTYAKADTDCLRDLASMFECMKVSSRRHSFLPIFFEVDPSQVKTWLAPYEALLSHSQDLVIRNNCQTDFQSKPPPSSSSEWIWPWPCDVFISFDTESDDSCSFVEFLSHALISNGFITASSNSFARGPLDKYELYMVVLTKSYICSTRSLQELARMVAQCIDSPVRKFDTDPPQQILVPIFFGIQPFQVTDIDSFFQNSRFLEHIKHLELNVDKVMTLLTQRQDLVAPHDHLKDQARFISKIVDKTINMYDGYYWQPSLRFIDGIAKKVDISDEIATVGIGSHRVSKLIELLVLGSTGFVRSVGISGMGGIGKTALAGDIFNKISHHFDSTYFLTNLDTHYASKFLPEVLLRITLGEEYVLCVHNIETSLRNHRILVVLDDVDDHESLKEFLIGSRDCFGGGSRIIITSRDERVLGELGVDEIHKVKLLNQNEALRLLCKTVFNCNFPMRGYDKVVLDALKYADGLPLAIRSLGSLLRDRSVSEWQRELEKLEMVPDSSVLSVLRKSFDKLDGIEKDMFLDIACCFAGEEIDYVKKILGIQYKLPLVETRIGFLIDKSLINVSGLRIKMHYMLQQLGKDIVRRESTRPGERSRVWRFEDFCHVMEANTGTEYVKVIVLSNQEYPRRTTSISINGLSKMNGLRVLIFHNLHFCRKPQSSG
ncbi:TMV resistance protein N-like isoform X2 [Prosopis cineraria]|uniref:TMV resistance protein N-like isoform X2 n=1 Tax=Prosopis cineraria TaxID=364024 RepID=UPI002410555B|nr:TMV resistance protein N-like isoform X2 [Prosopis cineraria]